MVRWGIASAGKISTDFTSILKALENEGHQVTAVGARNLERAQDFAKQFQIPKAYGSYKELAEDENVDVVYIGSIHLQHHPLTLMMTSAGKHVLCEKPLGMNEREVTEMGFWSRFFPVYCRIRALLADGAIGDVMAAQASFGFNLLDRERLTQPELGGGALMDLGCYCVQFILMVFGHDEWPQKIIASGTLTDKGVDKAVQVILQYSGGRTATFMTRSDCCTANAASIAGSTGTLEIPETFWCPTRLIVRPNPPVDTPSVVMEPVPDLGIKPNFLNSEGFIYEARAVKECIDKGETESELVPLKFSIFAARLMDEIRRQVGTVYEADKVSS